jgi:hypothetical protein
MEVLPPSLSYSAGKSASRYNRFQCRVVGTDSANPGDTVRIQLPDKSLVNMSSFCLNLDLELTGLTMNANNGFSQAKLPHGQKLFSAVRVYVGGQLVSGGLSNQYDILYNALVKASCGEDWVRSRYNEHAKELIENGDDINSFHQNVDGGAGKLKGYENKKARYVISDFLGVFRGNGGKSIIDTSLWGSVAIEFTFNSAACIAKRAGSGFGTTTVNASYKVSNILGYVECITQTTPLYIKLISLILDEKKDLIRFPYQNFITGVANTKSARLNINSGCIDMMVMCPLNSNYNSVNAAVTAGDLSAPRYKYTAVNVDGSAALSIAANAFDSTTTNIQIQIGSDTFPKVPITDALDVVDITTNSLFSNSLYSQNLLYNGLALASGADVSAGYDTTVVSYYSRQSFLKENFVYIQSFADQEGWAAKNLTGIDTASQNLDVIVNFPISTTAGSGLFIGALVTSMLVFDSRTGQVSVVQ